MMQIIIDTKSTQLQVKDGCFFISNGSTKRKISPKRVTAIFICANAMLSSSSIMLATENKIQIYYLNRFGKIISRTWSPHFTDRIRIRTAQLDFRRSDEAMDFLFVLFQKKTNEQAENLNWLLQSQRLSPEKVTKDIKSMTLHTEKLCHLTGPMTDQKRSIFMGIEGASSAIYWRTISDALPVTFQFEKRSRRPAIDPFNAAINYLYGMTYSHIEQAIIAAGLDCMGGLLHKEGYQKPILVFDLIEPFRPLVDRFLLYLILSDELTMNHFKNSKGVYLNKEGKRMVIPLYNKWLNESLIFCNKELKLNEHVREVCHDLVDKIKHYVPDSV